MKCLEHHLWARERGSPSPWPPTAQCWLESPLLADTVIFRVRKAAELVQSLLRTALPFQHQSLSTAAPLPPKGRAGRQTPRPPPISTARHREPPTALTPLCCKTLADTRAACVSLPLMSQKVAKILIIKSSNSSYLQTLKNQAYIGNIQTMARVNVSSVSLYLPPPLTPDLASHSRGQEGNTDKK